MYDRQTYCRGCGRMLRFIRTERGAWMPCESFPVRAVADENGALLYRADGTSFRGRIVDKWVTGAAEAWEPHFGRCANPVFAGSGGRKPREDPAVTERRRREARRRAEEEYKRVLASELEKREREWRERRVSLPPYRFASAEAAKAAQDGGKLPFSENTR